MNKKFNLYFLIGYPGCGKSTLSYKLYKYFHFDRIDTDEVIEQKYQMSISEIVSTYGFEKFREYERDILHNLEYSNRRTIVSTGGGLPCSFDNLEYMKSIGTVIYLKTGFWTLFWRLLRSTNRPNFKNKFKVYKELKKKIKEREHIYQQADYIIDNSKFQSKQIRNIILDNYE